METCGQYKWSVEEVAQIFDVHYKSQVSCTNKVFDVLVSNITKEGIEKVHPLHALKLLRGIAGISS